MRGDCCRGGETFEAVGAVFDSSSFEVLLVIERPLYCGCTGCDGCDGPIRLVGGDIRISWASCPGPGANVGREGESAAGEVFDRWSGDLRGPEDNGSFTVNREGVLGNKENEGVLVG